jgi:hypothetical protein
MIYIRLDFGSSKVTSICHPAVTDRSLPNFISYTENIFTTPFLVVQASLPYVTPGLQIAKTNFRYSDKTPFPPSYDTAQFGDEESIYTNTVSRTKPLRHNIVIWRERKYFISRDREEYVQS